jgi:hypothetical protein
MLPIMVEQQPADERLEQLGVRDWAVWSCEISQFPWQYDQREICYVLEGQAVITPDGDGAPVEIVAGDLVVFPGGMSCQWEVLQPVRKQYRIG